MDSEVICMVVQLLKDFGLKDLNVEVNSVGCPICRPAYREKLIEFFEPKKNNYVVTAKNVCIKILCVSWIARMKHVNPCP